MADVQTEEEEREDSHKAEGCGDRDKGTKLVSAGPKRLDSALEAVGHDLVQAT